MNYPCHGKCSNIPGSFECFCPVGTRGNATIGPCHKELPLAIVDWPISVGIAIGLGVGTGILLLTLSVIFFIRKKRDNIQKQLRKNYFRKNQGLLLEQLISSNETTTDSTRIFSLEELKVATNNFNPIRVLGSGGHGMVYKGILSDQRVVAIKKPNTIKEQEISQFINEVNHRNIVKLYGCCLETEVPLLVYDFVPNGSLHHIIHTDPSNREFSLCWNNCLRIATDVAGALYYLHSAASVSVLHRDVKSSNILLDANYTAKVSDFGASRFIHIDQTHVSTNIQGTFGYLDPEYYHTGHLNEKSDVYSFGVVLLELLLRKQAIFECESGSKKNLSIYFLAEITGRSITEIVAPEVLEEATEDELNAVASIAQACLGLRGEHRPTMKEVEMSLQSIRSNGLRSGCIAPDRNDEMQPPLTKRCVHHHHQALGADIKDLANLASATTLARATSLTRSALAAALCFLAFYSTAATLATVSTDLSSLKILDISLQLGQARVMNSISSSCYNHTSQTMNADTWSLNLTDTPYRFSDSANKFRVIGCRTMAYMFDDFYVGKYMFGCLSNCRRGDVSTATNGTCAGIGCCQTNIPTGLDYILHGLVRRQLEHVRDLQPHPLQLRGAHGIV
uniref:Protein kinase domain-containing protein n=1 Tax=Leersia perrieri TaxID=77586 RepID=A0A0D9W3X8_9ORYZ